MLMELICCNFKRKNISTLGQKLFLDIKGNLKVNTLRDILSGFLRNLCKDYAIKNTLLFFCEGTKCQLIGGNFSIYLFIFGWLIHIIIIPSQTQSLF